MIRVMNQTVILIMNRTLIQTTIRMVDSSDFQTRIPPPCSPPILDQKIDDMLPWGNI